MMLRAIQCLILAALASVSGAVEGRPPDRTRAVAFEIHGGSLEDALVQFTRQTGFQLLFPSEVTLANTASPVEGTLTPDRALRQLLVSSGLDYEFVNPTTISIKTAKAAPYFTSQEGLEQNQGPYPGVRLAQSDPADTSSSADRTSVPGPRAKETADRAQRNGAVPEILVRGSRALNMDIKRSRDDVQPYVVFSREAIERSGATDIQNFLKYQLTMATSGGFNNQSGTENGNTTAINLRGLGNTQTLILVDGHRAASHQIGGNARQPDINGIPLAAVERIEVLPTTASGIYGGSATGGVVNVVLRHDYAGVEAKVTYGNNFNQDVSNRRVDLSAGFSLEGGRTNVLFTGSYSDASALRVRENDILLRGREHILSQNPAGIYGATTPILGATTNIRSTTVVNGVTANLSLKNGTPLNSPITYVPDGYAGRASDGGAALVANAGKYNIGLARTAQGSGGGEQSLLNAPTIESGMLTIRREFARDVQAFVEVKASNNSGYYETNAANSTFNIPASAANNPFAQNIRVTTPALGVDETTLSTVYDRRIVGGLIVGLPADWRASVDYTWDRVRFFSSVPAGLTTAATTAVGNGTLDVLRDTNAFQTDFSPYLNSATKYSPVHTTLNDVAARLSGSLGMLPAGPVTLSLLLEHRKEGFDDAFVTSPTLSTFVPSRDQSVDSVYLETRVPLVSARNRVPAVEMLEMQIAGRRDRYKTTGVNSIFSTNPAAIVRADSEASSVDPTVGLRFKPVSDLMLRASYGTGFLPPTPNQLVPSAPTTLSAANALFLRDPRRGNESLGNFGSVTRVAGGNSDLLPEDSKSWSIGMILTPRWVPELRISVDWTKINKTDNISNIGSDQLVINNETFVPGAIVRGPAPQGDTFGVGPIVQIRNTLLNVAQANAEAYDFALDYRLPTDRAGTWGLSAVATRMMHNTTQLIPTAPIVENVAVSGVLEWKGNAILSWDYRQLSAAWTARYLDSYWLLSSHQVVANQGSATVRNQIYHDLFASYKIASPGGIFAKTEIQLGVNNIFNTRPPVDVNSTSTLYSVWGDPRLANYYISIRKAF